MHRQVITDAAVDIDQAVVVISYSGDQVELLIGAERPATKFRANDDAPYTQLRAERMQLEVVSFTSLLEKLEDEELVADAQSLQTLAKVCGGQLDPAAVCGKRRRAPRQS